MLKLKGKRKWLREKGNLQFRKELIVSLEKSIHYLDQDIEVFGFILF